MRTPTEVLADTVVELRLEIGVADRLIEERDKILDRLPCPLHGRCVPHVLETIDRLERHVKRQHVGSWAIWKLMNRWRPPCGRGPKIRSPRSMSATKRAKRGGE
jgi:hypothetical protein